MDFGQGRLQRVLRGCIIEVILPVCLTTRVRVAYNSCLI
jgi:hypothetical protein